MGFEQATIRVVREREFAELKSAIEKAVAGERIVKFLKVLAAGGFRIRDLEAVLEANALDQVLGSKAGNGGSII